MRLSVDNINLEKVITLALDPIKDAEINCLDELVKYVKDLAKLYPAPYHLFVSGGIDSQAMLYAWKLSGVEFTAIRVDYCGMNDHDFEETEQFCRIHGITLRTVEFDVLKFLEEDFSHYAETYQCASPHICTHMAFSELIAEGTKVFSGNLVAYDRIPVDNTIFGLQRYATLAKANVIPFFLVGNERIAKASVIISQKLSRAEATAYENKCLQYQAAGIPIIKQTEKFTGFEKIKLHYDQFTDRVTPEMKMRHAQFPSKRVFDQLFRNPYLLSINNHYTTMLIVKNA